MTNTVTPGPGIVPPVAAPANWWNPTPEEAVAFCVAYNLQPSQLVPWTQSPDGETHKATEGTNLVSFPTLPAITDEKTAMRYAAFGYGPDGVERLSTQRGFDAARAMADRVAASSTPGDFLSGAGNGKDSDAYALMCGFGKLDGMQSPSLGGGTSIAAIIKTLYGGSPRHAGDPGASGL